MIIKYEALWNRLPEIFDFVGLARERLDSFPEKHDRKSKDVATLEQRAALEALYAPLREKISSLPDCQII